MVPGPSFRGRFWAEFGRKGNANGPKAAFGTRPVENRPRKPGPGWYVGADDLACLYVGYAIMVMSWVIGLLRVLSKVITARSRGH